jgi:hypothetical protein
VTKMLQDKSVARTHQVTQSAPRRTRKP